MTTAIAFQEWKAESRASALARLTRSMAAVWRDGRKRSVDSTMIVPGDVIELASGDRIPADVRLHENASSASWASSIPCTRRCPARSPIAVAPASR